MWRTSKGVAEAIGNLNAKCQTQNSNTAIPEHFALFAF
jgi:hypothetical protein